MFVEGEQLEWVELNALQCRCGPMFWGGSYLDWQAANIGPIRCHWLHSLKMDLWHVRFRRRLSRLIPGNALSPNSARTCTDAAAVTITDLPCSTNSSRYPLSDPSRQCRMCALRAPAASAPAKARPLSFPSHRHDPSPIAFPSSGGRIRSPLIVPARAPDGKLLERCPW